MKKGLLIVLMAGALAACAVPLAQWFSQNNREDAAYWHIRQEVIQKDVTAKEGRSGSTNKILQIKGEENPCGADNIKVDFAALEAINEDCIGWLTIPGTAIDYPAVLAEGDEYLNRDFAGNKNRCGTIFARGDVQGQNLTLYGHHLKHRDVMFGPLLRYKDKNFYAQHKDIYFYTPEDREGRYEVIAAFNTKAIEDIPYAQTAFEKDELASLVRSACGRGGQPVPEISPDAKLLTLSTCDGSYGGSMGRFVVMARRV